MVSPISIKRNSFLKWIDKLQYSVIGFEFEFYSNHSYHKTLEKLNNYLPSITVYGFKTYHSDFKVTEDKFKIEPDFSGGANMCELITGPLPYIKARLFLKKILHWIKENGYTNDSCSVHINISFNEKLEKNIKETNILKLITSVDEDYIYEIFPDREYSLYAKSIKKISTNRDFDFSNIEPHVLNTSINLKSSKYYAINFTDIENRLEYRYIGGTDYFNKTDDIMKLMNYFILLSYDSLFEDLTDDNIEDIKSFLDENIYLYRKLSTPDSFMASNPSIRLQINQDETYQLISGFYFNMFKKLYDIIINTKSLKECIINYDTDRNKFEIVNGIIWTTGPLYDIDFIDCEIKSSHLIRCEILNSEVKNTHLEKCKVYTTEIIESKCISTFVNEHSIINDSYFYNGYLNGNMIGGTFRSGKLGKDAVLADNVQIVKGENFFGFKTKQNINVKDKEKMPDTVVYKKDKQL